MTGRPYKKPATGERALDFLDATSGVGKLRVSGAVAELGVASFEEPLNFGTNNKFIFTSAVRKPALTLNSATGIITGAITAPAGPPAIKRAFKGILVRNGASAYGYGHFTGKTQNVIGNVQP